MTCIRTCARRQAPRLFLLVATLLLAVACKKPMQSEEGARLRVLVDRYAAASDGDRALIFGELRAMPCTSDALCSSKALCEASMLSYRSAMLSKGLAGNLVATAHDDTSRAAALSKLEEAATQFLEAKNGFEECVRSASLMPRR